MQVTQITKPKGDNLDPWIEAVKRGEPPWMAYNTSDLRTPDQARGEATQATTDAQGRFRIDGLEAERVVDVVDPGSDDRLHAR